MKLHEKLFKIKPLKPAAGLLENTDGFAYTNTRVHVMKTRLLTQADYKRLLNMSLNEVTQFLQESDYKIEIDALATRYTGINLLEYGLTKNLERAFKRIHEFSAGNANNQIELYFKKWDYWNIKVILRGIQTRSNKEEMVNGLVAVGTFSEKFLHEVIENAQNIDQAIEYFRSSTAYPLLAKHKNNLAKLEDELDRVYYMELLLQANKGLREFGLIQARALNTLNALRLKPEKTAEYLLPVSKRRNVYLDVPEELQTSDEKTRYVKKTVLDRGLKFLHKFNITVDPLLGYFIAKETEINNLRLIIRGKHTDMPTEVIEKHLVYTN